MTIHIRSYNNNLNLLVLLLFSFFVQHNFATLNYGTFKYFFIQYRKKLNKVIELEDVRMI